MEWLSEVLKRITASRSFTAAIFVTAVLLLKGPNWFPAVFPKLPPEWLPVLTGVAIFTFTLLAISLVSSAWNFCKRARIHFRRRRLSQGEQALLFTLARHPDEPLHLDNLDYDTIPVTKLEVIETASQLAAKGLVTSYGDSVLILTGDGRRLAISTMRRLATLRAGGITAGTTDTAPGKRREP